MMFIVAFNVCEYRSQVLIVIIRCMVSGVNDHDGMLLLTASQLLNIHKWPSHHITTICNNLEHRSHDILSTSSG